jgi:hypothetical protein
LDELTDVDFSPPDFLFEKERIGYLPAALKIHEHHIKPLAENAYGTKTGTDSFNCLTFTKEQSELNKQRREKLIQAGDSQWLPVISIDEINQKAIKQRRVSSINRPTSKPYFHIFIYACTHVDVY